MKAAQTFLTLNPSWTTAGSARCCLPHVRPASRLPTKSPANREAPGPLAEMNWAVRGTPGPGPMKPYRSQLCADPRGPDSAPRDDRNHQRRMPDGIPSRIFLEAAAKDRGIAGPTASVSVTVEGPVTYLPVMGAGLRLVIRRACCAEVEKEEARPVRAAGAPSPVGARAPVRRVPFTSSIFSTSPRV